MAGANTAGHVHESTPTRRKAMQANWAQMRTLVAASTAVTVGEGLGSFRTVAVVRDDAWLM